MDKLLAIVALLVWMTFSFIPLTQYTSSWLTKYYEWRVSYELVMLEAWVAMCRVAKAQKSGCCHDNHKVCVSFLCSVQATKHFSGVSSFSSAAHSIEMLEILLIKPKGVAEDPQCKLLAQTILNWSSKWIRMLEKIGNQVNLVIQR